MLPRSDRSSRINISHYVKIILADIFGKENFVNHITIKRTVSKNNVSRTLGITTDNIFWFSTNINASRCCALQGKFFRSEAGQILQDLWLDTGTMKCGTGTGYATEKPKSLLERILELSSDNNSIAGEEVGDLPHLILSWVAYNGLNNTMAWNSFLAAGSAAYLVQFFLIGAVIYTAFTYIWVRIENSPYHPLLDHLRQVGLSTLSCCTACSTIKHFTMHFFSSKNGPELSSSEPDGKFFTVLHCCNSDQASNTGKARKKANGPLGMLCDGIESKVVSLKAG